MAKYTEAATVLSLGSFSKILAPGLRLGWIQTHPDLMKRLTTNGMIYSGGGLNPFTSAIVQSAIELGLQEKQLVSPERSILAAQERFKHIIEKKSSRFRFLR